MGDEYSVSDLKKKGFSLVLSGGSAYGLAHVGILKFLDEHSLKPKEIVGTSMGSIIGSLYAIGRNNEEIERILKKAQPIRLWGRRSERLSEDIEYILSKYFGERKIADAPIPLKIVATNFKTGKPRVFSVRDDVKIVDAVMASISIPGLFTTKKIKKVEYVDGGVSSNLPVEFADKKGVKLASNVINKYLHYAGQKKKKFFWRLTRKVTELESSLNYLLQNQTYSKIPYLKKVILIEPDLSTFPRFNFQNYKKLIEKGYEAIKRKFEGKIL